MQSRIWRHHTTSTLLIQMVPLHCSQRTHILTVFLRLIELIQPAFRGILGILSRVLKHGHNVKRIVITSSTAAAVRQSGLPATFSEEVWNDEAVESVDAQGKSAPALLIYFASKVLAEKGMCSVFELRKQC